MKSLHKAEDRKEISRRLAGISSADEARWGRMTVHQMIRHLDDSYQIALGERTAIARGGSAQGRVLKWLALSAPLEWRKGFPTVPEVEQGKGGSPPVEFTQDLAALVCSLNRFCDALPAPCPPHPYFGRMTERDWMRWGYLHADHHLRQFGR